MNRNSNPTVVRTTPFGSFGRWCCAYVLVAGVIFASKASVAQSSLTLHDAIQKAQQSPVVQMLNARVEEVRGSVRQAGLGLNPRLYLQSEDLRPWSDNFSFPTQTEDYGYIGQTFELAGKRGKRVALASARLHQAETERALRLRELVAGVSLAYWNAVSLQHISIFLNDDLKLVDEMVQYHKQRVDNGAMKGVDLLRMQIERDRLMIAAEAAKREAQQARLELFRWMAIPPYEVILVDKLDTVISPEPYDLKTVLAQRPEYQAAQDALRVAEADLKLQRANAIPDPDILAGYKRNNGDNTLYASLQIPLSFRNRNQGEVDRARASVSAAQAALMNVQSQIAIEVQQAETAFASQRKIAEETVPEMKTHAERNLEIVSEAYRLGGVDLLRFIDAERTKFDVEVSAEHSLAQMQQSAIQLRLAYGVQP